MVVALFGLLVVGAGLYYWSSARKRVAWADPKQQHLSSLLLVSASAFNNQNNELYQAAIKEIVYIMSDERWGRAEIEWRIGQALVIVKRSSSPEYFENVRRVGQNIIRATVQSSAALPWEARPISRLVSRATPASPS